MYIVLHIDRWMIIVDDGHQLVYHHHHDQQSIIISLDFYRWPCPKPAEYLHGPQNCADSCCHRTRQHRRRPATNRHPRYTDPSRNQRDGLVPPALIKAGIRACSPYLSPSIKAPGSAARSWSKAARGDCSTRAASPAALASSASAAASCSANRNCSIFAPETPSRSFVALPIVVAPPLSTPGRRHSSSPRNDQFGGFVK